MPTDDADPDVTRALMLTLAESWDDWPATASRSGPRVFVRWIRWECEDDEIGWDDWSFAGTISGDAVTWLAEERDAGVVEPIEAGVRAGEPFGKFDPEEGLTVWWCRSSLDGPPDDRTTDILAPA
jgi:hypothetical protein